MTSMTTLGAVFLPQLPPERLRFVASAADEAGLEELWLWEDCFGESGIATAAAALAWTQRLRVGIGLLPVPLRNVALTAMEVATLHRLFPGRVSIGVGHGVQKWMAQVGEEVESPLTLLREYLTALRALLAGERVTTAGRYVRLNDVALDWPPHDAPNPGGPNPGGPNPCAPNPCGPAVLAGAGGPRSLRLSGQCAGGTILTGGTSPDRVRAAVKLINEGRDAGADPRVDTEPQRIVVYVHAATGPDAEARLETERCRWGYASMSDISVSGDAPTMATALLRWVDAGADTIVVQPTPDDPDPEGFMRFVGRDLRPLMSRSRS
jgi:alkanesulfonate monooxygenase SsuD/methylene tetrahydromethanopterin reductase-like flavin-dependent oxidoreductase (luciferase family)